MRSGPRRARWMALGAALLGVAVSSAGAAEPSRWTENFSQGWLDPARWLRTVDGDFREWSVDVVDAGSPGTGDFRLRLRADTRGTRDDTLKYLGARSTCPIRLRRDTRISVQVDWNEQANSSYLSAAAILSPHPTLGNPLQTSEWLKVEYVGVPPGRNARMVVGLRVNGRQRTVYTEGWPETNRAGRRIAVQEVTLRFRNQSLEIWEGEERIYESRPNEVPFEAVYLYLQMSSHSNYPPRSIYFDNIRIDAGPDDGGRSAERSPDCRSAAPDGQGDGTKGGQPD